MTDGPVTDRQGDLAHLRVIELADEKAEYVGRLLAGLGADVIKVEPPEGAPTRSLGPFYESSDGRRLSLTFVNHNHGKKSVVLDLESADGRAAFGTLLEGADVLVESTSRGYLEGLGFGPAALERNFPELIVAHMSPFGEQGEWADFVATDFVHLAMGGPMMCTGYPADEHGEFDTPPIAPQLGHAYYVAGELLLMGILGAVLARDETGLGQRLVCPIHQAVSANTSPDVMKWIFQHERVPRSASFPADAQMQDGRWALTQLPPTKSPKAWRAFVEFMRKQGVSEGLEGEPVSLNTRREFPERAKEVRSAIAQLVRQFSADDLPWHDAQLSGLLWGLVRKPHENIDDPQTKARGSIREIEHPEFGIRLAQPVSKWLSNATAWQCDRAAPSLGQHTDEVLASPAPRRTIKEPARPWAVARRPKDGPPQALAGVRILDFSWWLASGGAPRFLSAMGAEDIKVEWRGAPDLRTVAPHASYPRGGQRARKSASGPLPADLGPGTNHGGEFNDWHAGQRSLSLNVRDPRGLEIAKELLAISDIVVEGFSPGVMDAWGLGYDVMRTIRPDIIYCQQSGFGQQGPYGKYRSFDGLSSAMSGVLDMAGLPEPLPPTGYGYPFMDWFGAYNLATAMLSALAHRAATGEGQWIDASHVESGIFLTGVPILDWSANGRAWQRTGNRAPYGGSAPRGAYPCDGHDRWIAIECRTDAEWQALCAIAGHREWSDDPRFSSSQARLDNHDELDRVLGDWTRQHERYELMRRLQAVHVPAGVCQDAEDRVEHDPQLAALEWLVTLPHTEMGPWPVKEFPVHLEGTPASMGGPTGRAAPCYGEDNNYVLRDLLGMSEKEVAALAEAEVI